MRLDYLLLHCIPSALRWRPRWPFLPLLICTSRKPVLGLLPRKVCFKQSPSALSPWGSAHPGSSWDVFPESLPGRSPSFPLSQDRHHLF